MTTITGLTAARMLAIEAASVISGAVTAGNLILTKFDGSVINAGPVVGPVGPTGPAGSALSVLSAASVLEPGISGQRRAGRVLSAADFTTLLGLSTPVGLFNLGDITNLGSAAALVNKGAVTFGKGITGAAVESAIFSGSTTQALYIADTGVADPFRINHGSWGCWFRTAKKATRQMLMTKMGATGISTDTYFVMEINNDVIRLFSNGQTALLSGISVVSDNRWHHAVAVSDGGRLYLYIDGVLEASTIATADMASVAASFNIGGWGADATTAAAMPFFGQIDEVFVTKDVILEDQVRMLYAAKIAHGATFTPTRVDLMVRRLRKGAALAVGNFPASPTRLYNFVAGSLIDAGLGATNLAAVNTPTLASSPDGLKDGAYQFFASTFQYLSSTDAGLPVANNVKTCGVWFKSSFAGNGGLLMWGAPVYGIWYGAGAISVGDWTFGGVSSSAIYNDGRWHFAVFVYDNAAVDGLKRKLYVDGVLVASDINAGTAIASVGAGGFLISNGTMGYFTGQSSRAFVAPTAYTADEISALYAVGSLSLGASPKNAGDHVERIDVTNLYLICDKFDSQDQIDIQVAS